MIVNPSYKKQLLELHKNPKTFNGDVDINNGLINFIEEFKPNTLVDFGCGKGALLKKISSIYPDIVVTGYDPGNVDFEILPTGSFDVLVSTDALEHVEPEMLDNTLGIIDKLFTTSCYLLIAGYPAKKNLPDGRNAHLIVEDFSWWAEKLKSTINGTIIDQRCLEVNRPNKKGQPTVGKEYIFVIKK